MVRRCRDKPRGDDDSLRLRQGFILRGRRRKSPPLIATAFGATPPTAAPAQRQYPANALRSGLALDEWLLNRQRISEAGLGSKLEASVWPSAPHALIDVSHRQSALEVNGRGAARLLNAGVPLVSIFPRFRSGMATRTLLTKAEGNSSLETRPRILSRRILALLWALLWVAILTQAAGDQQLC